MNHDADFDFDRVIDRRGTDSFKWSVPDGVLPMPIADMDFPAPPAVLEALRRRLGHPILGYPAPPPSLFATLVESMERDYEWETDPAWYAFLPGVVPGLQLALRTLNAGEAALTFTPVYPPFLHPPVLSGHRLYRLPLTDSGRRAEVDFDALERAPPEVRLLMWCHPQNPTGRCFSRGELERVADWCLRRDAIVVSDEIHCGLVIEPGARHIPLASLSPEIAARTITLMAPSKTYNIPGLCCSFAIIPDRELRRRFLSSESGSPGNLFGYVACEAAYRHGESWRKALLSYVRANRDYLETEVARMPGLRMLHPEATYLAWIDTRGTGLEKPVEHWRKKAGLELADGAFFGAPGWLRLNYACPRRTLEDGVRRLRAGAELARASA